MNDLSLNVGEFEHPYITAKGEPRASVALIGAKTLWFNTGTRCNITCVNCYIESSPDNDRLVYTNATEVSEYLDQITERNWPVTEIAFTGGEPFMNPDIIEMIKMPLRRGYQVLVLTNAMRPMMRRRIQSELLELLAEFGENLTLRISLDHFKKNVHDLERGTGSYEVTMQGMRWLEENGFQMTVAARSAFGEDDASSRKGFDEVFKSEGFSIDAYDPAATVLFPEMDENIVVPEITTSCWSILNKSPNDVMCATSRMVVKRKGADRPVVLACTLLPYSPEFELGETLAEAEVSVKLNHKHCAKFCVLGGASCSV